MARILVIDDEDEMRAMIRQLLEGEGYEVSEAPDGEIGMRKYKSKPCDLVITDIFMPVKEGIGTIVDLRRDFPDLKIIAITGGSRYSPEDFLSAAKAVGATRTFAKPFDLKEFLAAIKELLQERQVASP
jgi:CheY-like chemotaxis protein